MYCREQLHYKKLRGQYKRFLEEDRRRQERNENILRELERVEGRASVLAAKTERHKFLRRQYQTFIKQSHATGNAIVTQEPINGTSAPEFALERAFALERSPRRQENSEFHKDIVEKYFQSLTSPKRNMDAITKSRARFPYSARSDELNGLSEPVTQDDGEKLDQHGAISVADEIMNSIYGRKQEIASKADVSKPSYTSVGPEVRRDSLLNFGKTVENLKKSVEEYGYGDMGDNATQFADARITKTDDQPKQRDNLASKASENRQRQSAIIETKARNVGEIRHIDGQRNEQMLPNCDEKGILETLHDSKETQQKQEASSVQKGNMHYSDKKFIDENTQNDQHEQQLVESIRELDDSAGLGMKKKRVEPSDLEDQSAQQLASYGQSVKQTDGEYDPRVLENEQIIQQYPSQQLPNEQKQQSSQHYNETDHPVQKYDLNSQEVEELATEQHYPQNYDNDELSAQQYYENGNEVQQYSGQDQTITQHDDVKQPIQEFSKEQISSQHYDQNEQLRYDENGQPVQQYVQSGQPTQQYDENGQVVEQYVESDQPIQQYQENGQLVQQYDKDSQPIQQYDQNGQQYGESDQPMQQYEENSQLLQEYNESGQSFQQYDEDSRPAQQYDEYAQPTQQYDESRQPSQQSVDNVQPVLYESGDGRPLQQFDVQEQLTNTYDETGQPIQQYDNVHNQQYDEQGQLIQQYDDNGQPLQQYGQYGYEENGQPIAYDQYGEYGGQQYDENGQPIQQMYDENGQMIQNYGDAMYDENGQLLQQYAGIQAEGEQFTEDIQPSQQCTKEDVAQIDDFPDEKQVQRSVDPNNEVQEEQNEKSHETKEEDEGNGEEVIADNQTRIGNVLEMLDTDTESLKQETKASNDSDFDFSTA